MLFIVIERFKNKDAAPVYQRFREQGRMLPEGLKYLESWTTVGLDRCFQLMESDEPRLFEQWIARWEDLVDFEIIPVISSKEAMTVVSDTNGL